MRRTSGTLGVRVRLVAVDGWRLPDDLEADPWWGWLYRAPRPRGLAR